MAEPYVHHKKYMSKKGEKQMLKKAAFLVAILALVWAGAAWSTPPPAQGGYQAGWGMNPTNWQKTSGSFSAWGLYDPEGAGGGAGWVVGWNPTEYIDYADISLELWIEMYSVQTYEYTSYQWHRLGDQQETVEFIIQGMLKSNNGQYIILTRGTEDLTHLWFRENVLGGDTPSPPPDIPITWYGRYGSGLVYGSSVIQDWTVLTPDPDCMILIPDPCDHWFQFKGVFVIPYHQPDGYYSLTMAGCPAPVM
jgi:hypothetical protein